ncbi:hypothetical protein FKM82_018519 [Ascaphus truei]
MGMVITWNWRGRLNGSPSPFLFLPSTLSHSLLVAHWSSSCSANPELFWGSRVPESEPRLFDYSPSSPSGQALASLWNAHPTHLPVFVTLSWEHAECLENVHVSKKRLPIFQSLCGENTETISRTEDRMHMAASIKKNLS